MTTLLFGLFLAHGAFAAEPPCAETLVGARVKVAQAREAYRDAHRAYYAVDWKAKLATADDRDVVLADRKEAWSRVRALRQDVAEARVALKDTRAHAPEAIACQDVTSKPTG